MATINHFKTLNRICTNYFKNAKLGLEIDDTNFTDMDKKRMGFYYFILECTTGEREIKEIDQMITDTDYNKKIYATKYMDHGIDGIFIDKDNYEINLYNFKFREKFDEQKKQSENEAILSSKFLYALKNRSAKNLEGKLKDKATKIIEFIESDDEWKINLIMVSNESIALELDKGAIEDFKKALDLEVKALILDDIVKFMALSPESIDASFVIARSDCFKFSEASLDTSISFVLKISLAELLRITSDDKEMRERKNSEIEAVEIMGLKLDSNILFDNVRGFLGSTKYNEGIRKTLQNEGEKFFMYNNGITMTAKTIEAKEINGATKVKVKLEGLQVVNGGQTLKTVAKFKEELREDEISKLYNSYVLLRIFKIGGAPELATKIAEYTNSQNSISIIDLKSLGNDQILLEKYLKEHKIFYKRKIGEITENLDYITSITLEKLGQILYSINGRPHSASNSKKKIFEIYYDETFTNIKLEEIPEIILTSKNILEKKDSEGKKISDQKMFYVLYLLYATKKQFSIEELVKLIDETLVEYKPNPDLPFARRLLKKEFKDLIDQKMKINN
ncbi:AIPR family protein [Cetobacterium sp.]|uniref:AIPR family protein n=1 Tax=Cetobacterium sp. TaxID=2071632 RepID=UPI003F409040